MSMSIATMREWLNRTHVGDCRALLREMAEDGVRVQTCITSPPYFGLRDYGVAGQMGLEKSPAEYVDGMVEVFRAVRDVLAEGGTVWLNLGDSYGRGTRTENPSDAKRGTGFHAAITEDAGYGAPCLARPLPNKQLLGIPWRVALALQADGWYLRADIIWSKPNPMPESVTDRPTKAHEYLFLLSKSERYYYDAEAIREPDSGQDHPRNTLCAREPSGGLMAPHRGIRSAAGRVGKGRNRRSVWTVPTTPFPGAHFACFPAALIEPCVLAGASAGGTVLDPFMGSGTTAEVATRLGRDFIGCELNPKYLALHDLRRTTVGMPL
jgi:DNA modification methylase